MAARLNARAVPPRRTARAILLRSCLAGLLAICALPDVVAAQPVRPDVAQAIKAAGGDRELRAFYKARGYRPLWVQGAALGPEADRLLELVESAHLDGLDAEDYRPEAIAEAIERARGGAPKALARVEMLLSRSFAAYVRDVRRPREIGMVYVDRELAPVVPPARSVLEAAAAAPSLDAHLAGMGWMNPLYRELREALALSAGGAAAPRIFVPSGPILRPGTDGERVELLRLRLGLDPDGGYDGELVEAVRDAQARHGLPTDGAAGPRTLAALNAGAGGTAAPDRVRVLRVNLERARVLPAHPAGRYVLVDAASARLWMYENGRVRDTMKVIVGKPTEQTPMMAGLIRFAQVNPYWNIPPDLVPSRVAENVLAKGPSFLKAKRYQLLSDWSDDARILDPSSIDWPAVAAGRREVRVRQLPGGDNAMGKMKFMFPNTLGIYLHDTPEKQLFRNADRRFSSGCVRVEDAQRLARWLFGAPLKPRSGAPEQQVDLPRPVPVYITYLTAMPEGSGIAYRSDAYGRDLRQLAALESGRGAGR